MVDQLQPQLRPRVPHLADLPQDWARPGLQGLRHPLEHKGEVGNQAKRFHPSSVAKAPIGIVKG